MVEHACHHAEAIGIDSYIKEAATALLRSITQLKLVAANLPAIIDRRRGRGHEQKEAAAEAEQLKHSSAAPPQQS
jgi:hypothetical protein